MDESNALTLIDMLRCSARAHHDNPALSSWHDGTWQTITYGELWDLVRRFGQGLRSLGVKPGDRVAVAAESSPHWVIADFGILAAGAINTAMFPSLPPAQMEYILADSGAWIILVGDAQLLQKALTIRENMPDLQIVLLDGAPPRAPTCCPLSKSSRRWGRRWRTPCPPGRRTWPPSSTPAARRVGRRASC